MKNPKNKPLRRELTPEFLAAARTTSPKTLLTKMLDMTEHVRSDILIPASKALDTLIITQKENSDMRNAEAKNVTVATDQDCERAMQDQLKKYFPDAFVIGEEMFGAKSKAEKAAYLDEALKTDKLIFLVDALDGTRDFTQGNDGFAIMVTAMQKGEVLAAVVHRVTDHGYADSAGHTLTFEKGDGVRYDGRLLNKLSDRKFKDDGFQLRGYAGFEFVSAMRGKNAAYPDLSGKFDSVSDLWTCSKMYADIVTGQHHFMLVTPPIDVFDYPAGIALVQAAGGVARFLDGKDATFAEIVKRQSFSLKDGDNSFKDTSNTMIFAVSEGVFSTVQKTVLEKIAKPQAGAKPASPTP